MTEQNDKIALVVEDADPAARIKRAQARVSVGEQKFAPWREAFSDIGNFFRTLAAAIFRPEEYRMLTAQDAEEERPRHRFEGVSERGVVHLRDFHYPDNKSPKLLDPDVTRFMNSGARARQMVETIFSEARLNGLDANLFANQMYWDSLASRKEIPADGSVEQSIARKAEQMGRLTKLFDGDQRLAAVAYCGSEEAVNRLVADIAEKPLTTDRWETYLTHEFDVRGEAEYKNWYKQTKGFIEEIDSGYWSQDMKIDAGGKGPTKIVQSDPKLPMDTALEKGREQFAIAARGDSKPPEPAQPESKPIPGLDFYHLN